MKIFYTDHFVLPLPPEHRFPMQKYAQLRQRLLDTDLIPPDDLHVPAAATDEQLARVHTAEYLNHVKQGTLSPKAVRQIGFPWSPQLVERSRRSVGATIAAARAALSNGCGVNLAGGTHHAFADGGQGFCVFNDAAVATRTLQAERPDLKVIIIDCDVHQGNGTAAIFQHDPTCFTFSIHGEKNFPFRKEESDLDIALPDGTTDAPYLTALADGLEHCFSHFQPNLAIYLAGADPYQADRLGRLALTKAGLAERDRMVLTRCRQANLPVAVAMAGGYAPHIEEIVDIHYQTIKECQTCFAHP